MHPTHAKVSQGGDFPHRLLQQHHRARGAQLLQHQALLRAGRAPRASPQHHTAQLQQGAVDTHEQRLPWWL